MKTDNELIAEFMGEEIELINTVWYMPKHITHEGERIECHNYLRYDTSWDWLMPVVEKIRKTEILKEWFDKDWRNEWPVVSIHAQVTYIHIGDQHKVFTDKGVYKQGDMINVFNTSIEACYRAVVHFIKWYNKEKSNLKKK